MSFVLDASIALQWFREDEWTAAVDASLDRVHSEGARFFSGNEIRLARKYALNDSALASAARDLGIAVLP